MARYRKSTFIEDWIDNIADHVPIFLTGIVLGLLAVLLIGGFPHYSPVLKGMLPGGKDAGAVSSSREAPPAQREPAEDAPPEEETPSAPAESEKQGILKWLWSKAARFWPVLLVLIAVMEAAEYIGKFFALIRKFFQFLSDQF